MREPEQVLRDFAPRFESEFAAGDAALAALRSAAAERRQHRAHEIAALFDAANGERKAVAGLLAAKEVALGLPAGFSEAFFRKTARAEEDAADLKRRAILLNLAARGVEVSKESRKKILAEESEAALDRWHLRSVTAADEGELFAG